MALLFFRYFTPFPLHEREMIPKLKEARSEEEWEKNRIEKKENQTSAWGQPDELGRRRHPSSASHTAVPQLVMLWLGQHAGSHGAAARWEQRQTHVLSALESVLRLAHRSSKEEERQAEEGKQMEIGDRRLKFGLWLVEMRRHQEKTWGEREVNPSLVRKKWRYLEAFRMREESGWNCQMGQYILVYHFMQETCAASGIGFSRSVGRVSSLSRFNLSRQLSTIDPLVCSPSWEKN